MVHQVLLVPQVKGDRLAQQVQSDFQADPGPRDPLDHLGKKEDLVRKALKALLVGTVSRDQLVFQARLDLLGLLEKTGTRVNLVSQGRKEAKATRENMVHLVLPVQ